MSVTKASATRTVRFIPKLGTFAIDLLPSTGELWQNYTGSPSTPDRIVPDFSQIKPTVDLLITSSRVEEGEYLAPRVEYYLGSELIGSATKSGNTWTIAYASNYNIGGADVGMFEILAPEGSRTQHGIQIHQNLVNKLNGASTVLKAIALTESGTASDSLTCSTPIKIQQEVSGTTKVVIESADGFNFQITNNNKDTGCQLVAKVYTASDDKAQAASNYAYEWYVQNSQATGGWERISSATDVTLTVKADMVTSCTLFRVIVRDGTGAMVGHDSQFVVDATDPLVVTFEIDPIGETIESVDDTVKYKPSLVYRETGLAYNPPSGKAVSWRYAVLDSHQVLLAEFKEIGSDGIATVGYNETLQADGIAVVTFEAIES